jgi:hypothetical protein
VLAYGILKNNKEFDIERFAGKKTKPARPGNLDPEVGGSDDSQADLAESLKSPVKRNFKNTLLRGDNAVKDLVRS